MASNENKDPIGYLMDKFRSLLGLKNSQEKKNAIPPKACFSIWYPTGLVGRHPDDKGRGFAGSNNRPEKLLLLPKAGFMVLTRQGGTSGSTGRSYWWRASLIILLSTACSKTRTNRWWFRHWVPISPPRRRTFSKALILSTSLSHTTGTRQAETASNGLRPN